MSEEKTPELLARAYRVGAVIGWAPAARGWAGEIFRLRTPSGAYAAKEFVTQRPDIAAIERQVAFADACRAAGVPNPETLSTAGGGLLFDHPATGRPWLMQRWVDGAAPERTDVPTACWLAYQAATIHRLAVPCDPAEPVNPFYAVARTGWAEIAETARGAGFAFAPRLGSRADEFEDLAALVNAVPVGEVVTCHRDLKSTNTLVGADGARFLLDWDTSGPQEPWRELGMLLLHHVGSGEALADIAGAYRSAGGRSGPSGAEVFATGLAVWLNFLYGQICGALDPAMDDRFRASARESAGQLVDGIPSLSALDTAARTVALG
jgi:aminoglycoside phosphotransferase (APT) family kinase protein